MHSCQAEYADCQIYGGEVTYKSNKDGFIADMNNLEMGELSMFENYEIKIYDIRNDKK